MYSTRAFLCIYLAIILGLLEDDSTLKPMDKITSQIFRKLRLEPLKSTKIVFYAGINLLLFILLLYLNSIRYLGMEFLLLLCFVSAITSSWLIQLIRE